jgi:hypothetical protein
VLAPAWRAVLSPSPASLKGARDGGVAERLKAHAWKVCMRETVSRVRIPPPPPVVVCNLLFYNTIFILLILRP